MRTHLSLKRKAAPSSGRCCGSRAPRDHPEVRRILHGTVLRQVDAGVPAPPVPAAPETPAAPEPPAPAPPPEPAPAPVEEKTPEKTPEEPEKKSRRVCMTFDDGPQNGTEDCLNALAATVPATFFLTGKNMASDAPRQKALVERILAEGHQIGNHTFTHDPQASAEYKKTYGDLTDPVKLAAFNKNFTDNEDHFRTLLGASSPVFTLARLPGDGRFVKMGGDLVYVKQTESLGMAHVTWNFEFGTTRMSGKPPVEKAVFGHLKTFPWQGIDGVAADHSGLPADGDIVLLHDRHWNGKQAKLEAVIAKLRGEGFTFAKIDASGKCGS